MLSLVRFSTKCKRCGLRYPKDEKTCPYCTGLTDQQVREVKWRHKSELEGNTSLGQIFIYIAGLLVVLLLIYLLGY